MLLVRNPYTVNNCALDLGIFIVMLAPMLKDQRLAVLVEQWEPLNSTPRQKL